MLTWRAPAATATLRSRGSGTRETEGRHDFGQCVVGQESDADGARTGFDGHALLQNARFAAVRSRVDLDAEDVLGIHGEMVGASKSPPAESNGRSSLMRSLRHAGAAGARRSKSLTSGLRLTSPTARRLTSAADGHVTLDQHRRKREHVADVVEAVAGIVGGELGAGLDVERQQVANGVAVFGAIQAVNGGTAGIRMRRGGVVEFAAEPLGESERNLRLRVWQPGGRHLPGIYFTKNLFPGGGVFADVGGIQGLDGNARGFEFLVVAADAVLVHQRARGGLLLAGGRQRQRDGQTGESEMGGENGLSQCFFTGKHPCNN